MAQGKSSERTERISLRVTPEEMETIKGYAAAAGLSVTAFLIGEAIGDKIGQVMLDGFAKSTGKRRK